MGPAMRAMKKVLGVVLVVAGIGSGLGVFLLSQHYAHTRPRMPEPSAGRIIPMNLHGTVVFLDRSEDALLEGLGLFAAIGSACGAVFLMANRGRR
jgi:hypothetical protein